MTKGICIKVAKMHGQLNTDFLFCLCITEFDSSWTNISFQIFQNFWQDYRYRGLCTGKNIFISKAELVRFLFWAQIFKFRIYFSNMLEVFLSLFLLLASSSKHLTLSDESWTHNSDVVRLNFMFHLKCQLTEMYYCK